MTVMAAALLGSLPAPRVATRARLPLDDGLAIYFPAPHSYTGEHVLELHCHGGAVLVESLIARALELGARRARPGEFTQRAYLNSKLDLAQAEAVADLIDAASEAAARAAARSLQGEFSARVRALGEALTALRVQLEAGIDFADEPNETVAERQLRAALESAGRQLEALLDTWRKKYPGVQVSQDVVHGHPGRALVGVSAHADLVVIGRRSTHAGQHGPGTVTHAVLNHAHGPIVTVPSAVSS
jgi:tRNA modification GTPase